MQSLTTKNLCFATWIAAGCGVAVAFLYFVRCEPYWLGLKIFLEESLLYAVLAIAAAMARSRLAAAFIFIVSLAFFFLGAYADIDLAFGPEINDGVMWVGLIRCELALLVVAAALLDFFVRRSFNVHSNNP